MCGIESTGGAPENAHVVGVDGAGDPRPDPGRITDRTIPVRPRWLHEHSVGRELVVDGVHPSGLLSPPPTSASPTAPPPSSRSHAPAISADVEGDGVVRLGKKLLRAEIGR